MGSATAQRSLCTPQTLLVKQAVTEHAEEPRQSQEQIKGGAAGDLTCPTPKAAKDCPRSDASVPRRQDNLQTEDPPSHRNNKNRHCQSSQQPPPRETGSPGVRLTPARRFPQATASSRPGRPAGRGHRGCWKFQRTRSTKEAEILGCLSSCDMMGQDPRKEGSEGKSVHCLCNSPEGAVGPAAAHPEARGRGREATVQKLRPTVAVTVQPEGEAPSPHRRLWVQSQRV